jgi:hypothetical protein
MDILQRHANYSSSDPTNELTIARSDISIGILITILTYTKKDS